MYGKSGGFSSRVPSFLFGLSFIYSMFERYEVVFFVRVLCTNFATKRSIVGIIKKCNGFYSV